MNQPTKLRIASALAALISIKSFIGPAQSAFVKHLIQSSEERDFFIDKILELQRIISTMPGTYQQDGLGDNAIVHLRYFTPRSYFLITEKEIGAEEDDPSDFQKQAYGYACVNGEHDMGYISLPEILAAGAEIDFHFTPSTIGRLAGTEIA